PESNCTNRGARPPRSDARQPRSDELSLCQRRPCRQSSRQTHRNVRRAPGAAGTSGIVMWRKLSNFQIWLAELRHVRHKIALFAVAVLWIAAVDLGSRGESKDWIVLNNCNLITTPSYDGDNLHV